MAQAGEAGVTGRTPGCLCVLCGLPAVGKSTLARTILGTAARQGWRACTVSYDDVIPEHAFQITFAEDSVRQEESVSSSMINWHVIFCVFIHYSFPPLCTVIMSFCFLAHRLEVAPTSSFVVH